MGERRSSALHEAAHAVACLLIARAPKLHCIELFDAPQRVNGTMANGRCRSLGLDWDRASEQERRAFVARDEAWPRALVLMAGPAADALFRGDGMSGGDTDMERAAELLHHVAPNGPELSDEEWAAGAARTFAAAWADAQAFVARERGAIERVADALIESTRLDVHEVLEAMRGHSAGSEPASSESASVTTSRHGGASPSPGATFCRNSAQDA